MIQKIVEQVSQLNKISKYVLKYGLLVCLVWFIFVNYRLDETSTINEVLVLREIAGCGFYTLMEIIIGAVLLDIGLKRQ